jgi:hypothetical protein
MWLDRVKMFFEIIRRFGLTGAPEFYGKEKNVEFFLHIRGINE